MGPTSALIREYARKGHPLGFPVSEDEVQSLTNSLITRLNTSCSVLDLSPGSLKTLEAKLVDYHASLQEQNISNDDLVNLVREVTAYVGEILVRNFNGRWNKKASSLWDTDIVLEGQWNIKKDNETYDTFSISFVIGGEAAWAWDLILDGKKPNLYHIYRDAKSKHLRERL